MGLFSEMGGVEVWASKGRNVLRQYETDTELDHGKPSRASAVFVRL